MEKTTYRSANGPVVLCIMDGWGHRIDPTHNAVALAKTPVFDKLWTNCPHSFWRHLVRMLGYRTDKLVIPKLAI